MEIRFTKIAVKDIINIKSHISEVSKDNNTAEKVISKIIRDLEKISIFPEGGARYEDDDGNLLYRYVKSDKYYSFYKCNKDNIDVYRILFARRNFKNIL